MDSRQEEQRLTLCLELDGPHRHGSTRQLRADSLDDLETLPEDAHRTPRSSSARGVDLRRVFSEIVDDLGVEDRVKRVELIGEDEVLERSGSEAGSGESVRPSSVLRVVGRRPLRLVVVVPKLLKLVEVLVAELGRDEEESRLEDAEGRGDGDGVEVLDLECGHLLVLMLDRHLVQITLLTLEKEEECTLRRKGRQRGNNRRR
jgi:hypothetical protein